MVVFLGDLHFRSEEPFYSASREFCNWFVNQDFNNPDNTLIQLGDVLHESKSNGAVNYLMMDLFFRKLKFKKIYILQGNHDTSKQYGSGLKPLKVIPEVEVIEIPCEKEIEGLNYVFLPYYYPYSNGLRPMKEEYENPNFLDEFELHKPDYIVTHVSDETQTLDKHYIDLSQFKCKRISGHIHIPSENYLGTPYPTRSDERQKKNVIRVGNEHVEIPSFIDYYNIKFGESLPEVPAMAPIWEFFDAPSREAVNQMYGKNIHILHVHKTKPVERKKKKVKTEKEHQSVEEYFETFCMTNDIEPELQTLLGEKIRSHVA